MAYFTKPVFVNYLYFTSINSYYAFIYEVGECPYGVRCCHIGEICQIFTGKVNIDGGTIFLQSVTLFKENQGLCKPSAYMLLCEVYYPLISNTQINRQHLNEKHCKIAVLAEKLLNQFHRNHADCASFESRSGSDVWLTGEIGPVTEILHWPYYSDYLTSATYSTPKDLNLARKKRHIRNLGISSSIYMRSFFLEL